MSRRLLAAGVALALMGASAPRPPLPSAAEEQARITCSRTDNVEDLRAKLQSPERMLQLGTVRGLGEHPEKHQWAIEDLARLSQSPSTSSGVRREAALSSVKILAWHIQASFQDPEAMDLQGLPLRASITQSTSQVQQLLGSRDWEARAGAAQGLGEMNAAASWAIPDLQASFEDPNNNVRVKAAAAVARISASTGGVGKAAASFLMDHTISEVQIGTAQGLGELGAAAADFLPRLESSVVNNPLEQVRVDSAEAVVKIATLLQRPKHVQRLIESERLRIRQAAVRGLASLGEQAFGMLALLRGLYEDPGTSPDLRLDAAAAAAEIAARASALATAADSTSATRTSESVDVQRLLAHPDAQVQRGAARGVGSLGTSLGPRMVWVVPHLRRLFSHEDADVCIEAAGAAAKILAVYGQVGRVATEFLLDHSYAEVREGAAIGLGDLGAVAQWVLPELRLDDGVRSARRQAARASAKIAAASGDEAHIRAVLFHERWGMQMMGMQGVGELGSDAAWVFAHLREIMDGVERRPISVRAEAARASAKIAGMTGNVLTVAELLGHTEEPLRRAVADGLAELGIGAAWVPHTVHTDLRTLFEDYETGELYSTSDVADRISDRSCRIVEALNQMAHEQPSNQS